jgi:hypothetical protein
MKFILTCSFVVIYGFIYCQSKSHLINITVSNNGQIEDVLDGFYWTGAYGPGDDTYSYKRNAFKFNLMYELLTISKYSFHGRIGFGTNKNTYNISNVTVANGNTSQNFFNFSLGSKYNFTFDKFQISTGLEIPFYYIGKYTEKFYWDNQTESQIITYDVLIDDGYSIGLNSITSIKFYPTKRFFIMADIVFGAMHFNLGDKYYYKDNTESTIDPSITSQYSWEIERSYKTTVLTKPELHFGFGIKFN